MSKIKLSLASLTVPQKIQFARQVAQAMANAAAIFPDPPHDFHAVRVAAISLETAFNAAHTARQAAVERTTAQNNAEAALDAVLTTDAGYVQSVSAGDASIIESAGMNVRATPSPIGLLPQPVGLVATSPAFQGRVDLKWRAVKGKSSYLVESTITPAVETSWTYSVMSTKTKLSVTGLTSGTKHWFRVAAINAAGTGAWSEAVGKIVE